MIQENKIKTKHGDGIYYSTEINGEKYVSQIVNLYDCSEDELAKWKKAAKQQVARLIKPTQK